MATDDEVTETPTTDERVPGERDARARSEGIGERYQIAEEIGRGGMGHVLAATDTQLRREVAIKRPRAAPSDRQVARFVREAHIQGRLDHPAIVPVHELGRDARGLPYFAMKRLAGTTLSASLRDHLHPRARLLRAFADICLAVEFAHVRGVIHRDLKPDNIVLGDYGEVYVLDWGVAKVAGEDDDFDDLLADGLATATGTVIGTPAYMAPEQARDSSTVDARADVYALGRILADILAAADDAPPELVAVRDSATAVQRDDRIASARELGAQVQGFLDGDRDLALRRQLAREHLEQARAAFSAGLADRDRGMVIRAASSAMALDPTLAGAAELVGRLMLEPPREVPPEVERAVLADDVAWIHSQGHAALRSTAIGFVCIVPMLVFMGAVTGAIVFGALSLFNIGGLIRGLRKVPFAPIPMWVVGVMSTILIAMISHLFAPLVVAPAVASVVAATLGASPFIRTLRGVVALGVGLVAAIVLPAVAEYIGLLPATMDPTDAGILLHPPAHASGWALIPCLAVFATGAIASGLVVARSARAQERDLRSRLQLQMWQLRQLVADPLAT